MFCPNCGKQIKDNDNFCRYCGSDLRVNVEDFSANNNQEYVVHHYQPEKMEYNHQPNNDEPEYKLPDENSEELVLCDIKKHWMALFWPVVLTPVFFIYFWFIFLNTHSFFSWVIVALLLILIVYPIMRYNSDKIVITTKYAHIKIGVLNPEEVDIPLSRLGMLEVSQTTVGRILDYGTVSFAHNSERFEYGYIEAPEELQYIIDNPARFVDEVLNEEEPV